MQQVDLADLKARGIEQLLIVEGHDVRGHRLRRVACVLNPALLAAQVKTASAAEQADRRKRSPPSRSAEEGVVGG